MGTLTGAIFAIDPNDSSNIVQLAAKTIKKFRLGKGATQRITLTYVPTSMFGSSYDMHMQLIATTTPPDQIGNGAIVHVTLT